MDKIELIDRVAVIDTLRKCLETKWFESIEASMYYRDSIEFAMSCINAAPTIDAVPVRRGKWVHGRRNGTYGIWCSRCGTGWEESLNYEVIAASHNFCPNCGADMRGEKSESLNCL